MDLESSEISFEMIRNVNSLMNSRVILQSGDGTAAVRIKDQRSLNRIHRAAAPIHGLHSSPAPPGLSLYVAVPRLCQTHKRRLIALELSTFHFAPSAAHEKLTKAIHLSHVTHNTGLCLKSMQFAQFGAVEWIHVLPLWCNTS